MKRFFVAILIIFAGMTSNASAVTFTINTDGTLGMSDGSNEAQVFANVFACPAGGAFTFPISSAIGCPADAFLAGPISPAEAFASDSGFFLPDASFISWNSPGENDHIKINIDGSGAAFLGGLTEQGPTAWLELAFTAFKGAGIEFTNFSSAPPTQNGGSTGNGAAVIPLPAAGWLLLSGLGILAITQRRRRATG